MITVAVMVRDNPDIFDLFDLIRRKIPCEYELVIGDNSQDPDYSEKIRMAADEYIPIMDKQLFRMGLPWGHNLINSIANTYKMFYIDADEYPVWINPNIEEMFDTSYVIPTIRWDFLSSDRISFVEEKVQGFNEINDYCKDLGLNQSIQDRIYNSRYAQFDGLCHSVFHVPMNFRAKEAGAILLHNKNVRDAKDKDRMDKLIDEQFARQNINFMLASAEVVLGWGKGVRHRFEDWKEWNDYYDIQEGERWLSGA